MPTTKTRINLTVPDDLQEPLAALAKRDNVRVSTKALELLGAAIEREEDALWTKRADERLEKEAAWVSSKRMLEKYA